MVRISDFVFDTSHPPKTVGRPLTKRLAKLNVPGKNASIIQDLGSDNMRITLGGSMFNTTGDTNKRRNDMNTLIGLAMANNPMTFVHDKDHPCGEDGDNWSDYTSTTDMDVDWTASGLTRDIESNIKKFGNRSIKLTSTASGTMTLDNISAYNLNMPEYSALCFWIRATSATATNDDITIKCITSGGNYYYRKVDASTDFVANTWAEIVFPVGSGASTATAGVDGWTETGSPDWTNINSIELSWGASATGTVYLDGFCITHAVLFEGIPTFDNPTGNPNKYNYRIQLVQYLQ